MKIAPIRITIPTCQADLLISNAILSPISQLQKACEMFEDRFHASRLCKVCAINILNGAFANSGSTEVIHQVRLLSLRRFYKS